MERSAARYTPYYCEENVYHLCSEPELADRELAVVFISNADRHVAVAAQRARADGLPVVWDYHVVLLADREAVYDLDSILGFPEPVASYVAASFPRRVKPSFRPQLKLVDARHYRSSFCSDRSHMIGEDGRYLAPPPQWPPIRPERGTNLSEFIDMSDTAHGRVVSLTALGAYILSRRGG